MNDPSADFTCEKCGKTWYGLAGPDMTVGVFILARSWHELEIEKDYDMAIVLAATALDCELSRLYCKWGKLLAAHTDSNAEDCEEGLRRLGNITGKIQRVSEVLYSGGIEKFVADSDHWMGAIRKGFPSLHLRSLARGFQEAVFWPRNRILHRGEVAHTREDAAKCYSIAELGIGILKNMDETKREAADM